MLQILMTLVAIESFAKVPCNSIRVESQSADGRQMPRSVQRVCSRYTRARARRRTGVNTRIRALRINQGRAE